MKNCIFCDISRSHPNYIAETKFFWIIWDSFPVNLGHALIISKEHVKNISELVVSDSDLFASQIPADFFDAIEIAQTTIDKQYCPAGYNFGINEGTAAGQTIMHFHCHVIPRYYGDVEKPRGGVRGVIPEKQDYKETK